MSEYKTLTFNPECLNIYQSGGFEVEEDWWMVVVGVIVLVIIISLINFTKKSNVNSSSVTISKKSVDGEDVYYKEVDGEEQDLTEEEKLKYDQMFEENRNNSIENLEIDSEDIIDDASYIN